MEISSFIRTKDIEEKKRLYVDTKVKNIIYEDSYYLVIRAKSIKIIISHI